MYSELGASFAKAPRCWLGLLLPAAITRVMLGWESGEQESVNVMASSVTSVPHWESLAKHFCLQGDTGPLRQSLELELLRITHEERTGGQEGVALLTVPELSPEKGGGGTFSPGCCGMM